MFYIKNILVFMFLCLPIELFAQEHIIDTNIRKEKHLNRIFVIDNTIPDTSFGSICEDTRFILEYKDSKRDTVEFDVYPGKVILLLSDYEYIMKQEDIETIYMQFSYCGNCYYSNKQGRIEHYDYEIPFKYKTIFEDRAYYMIIYIYNTDKKENKKYYVPLPNKTYNYRIVYPEGGFGVIQKKMTKKQKDCWKYYEYRKKKERRK